MPETLREVCPEDSLVSAVYIYSKGTTKALCNTCHIGTVPQPRDLIRVTTYME